MPDPRNKLPRLRTSLTGDGCDALEFMQAAPGGLVVLDRWVIIGVSASPLVTPGQAYVGAGLQLVNGSVRTKHTYDELVDVLYPHLKEE
jgi:hypothetical protein